MIFSESYRSENKQEKQEKEREENAMPNAVVTLKKGAGRTLKQGGPWIYDNEIESHHGEFCGRGYCSRP